MQLSLYFIALSANAAIMSGLQGECGPHGDINFGACDNRYNSNYPCCSPYGYCGGNEQYCGAGCKPEYSLNGKCELPSATTTPAPAPTVDAAQCAAAVYDFNDRLRQCYVATHRNDCPCDETSINLLKRSIRECGPSDANVVKANDIVKESCKFSVL